MTGTHFLLRDAALDIPALNRRLDDPGAGAFCVFEGRVRNLHRGRAVTALDYQAYEELANREGQRILAEARERFELIDAYCEHRVGHLVVGEPAVWVGVLAGHREAAFSACRWILDEVKARVPIWKREYYEDGPTEWIHPEQ